MAQDGALCLSSPPSQESVPGGQLLSNSSQGWQLDREGPSSLFPSSTGTEPSCCAPGNHLLCPMPTTALEPGGTWP